MLSSAQVVERVRQSTGLDDLGPDHYLELLELWLADTTRGAVSDVGAATMVRLAERNLALRARLLKTFADHPEIDEVELPPVVLISGFARSGTTLLHTLLGLHPQARTMRRWELLSPLPPPETATWATDPRIAHLQDALDRLRGNGLEEMHWVEAHEPEECTHSYYDLSGLVGRGVVPVAPTWWTRVFTRDEHSTLTEYRRLLQLLLWRNPPAPGSVLVLKNPTTAVHLTEFTDVFPRSTVVLTHRDPYRCITSMCRVSELVSQPFLAPGAGVDSIPGGAGFMLDALGRYADRMLAFSADAPGTGHVQYADLMHDPIGTSAQALTLSGLPVPPDWADRVGAYLAWQRSGGRAKAPASYDVALSRRQVSERDELQRYVATFGVAEERERVTDPVR